MSITTIEVVDLKNFLVDLITSHWLDQHASALSVGHIRRVLIIKKTKL